MQKVVLHVATETIYNNSRKKLPKKKPKKNYRSTRKEEEVEQEIELEQEMQMEEQIFQKQNKKRIIDVTPDAVKGKATEKIVRETVNKMKQMTKEDLENGNIMAGMVKASRVQNKNASRSMSR